MLQRVCPSYRIPVFASLCQKPGLDTTLLIGEADPRGKAKNAPDLSEVNHRKLKTRFLRFRGRVLTWHSGLLRTLRTLRPDVILCEGESHFLGYLKAICYQKLFDSQVALIHWSFVSLPGEDTSKLTLGKRLKAFFRQFFDAFVLYSSFSKDRLLELGVSDECAFVATNVGHVKRQLALADSTSESTGDAQVRLGLPQRFTVLFLGTLDANKRPEILLDLAGMPGTDHFNYLLLGTGPMESALRARAEQENLENVHVCGRVVDELPYYLRAANVLLVPGRGGIVFSEAMSFCTPIVVHEADGTEYDLVNHQANGIRVQNGTTAEFQEALQYLANNPDVAEAMGAKGREMVEHHYTTDNMVDNIVAALHHARASHITSKNP